jgi:putative hydrolase of the HAD superfamily
MNGGCVRGVVFDAVGTLIHPHPDAFTVYAETGCGFGSRLQVPAIRSAFQLAFARQEEIDRGTSWRTSESREIQRWRAIVAEVLPDVTDREGCFQALFAHFARPTSWRPASGAEQVLQQLRARGLPVGLASNFDHRLVTVVKGFAMFGHFQSVIISSEIGWRKPAKQFFDAVCGAMGFAAHELAYVGDDLKNDFAGATQAGMKAIFAARDLTSILQHESLTERSG